MLDFMFCNEKYWNSVLWKIIGPLMLVCLVLIIWRILRPLAAEGVRGRCLSPCLPPGSWLMLIVQNVIAQLITGPWSAWNEVAFSIYYVLLFFISAVIIYHYHFLYTRGSLPRNPPYPANCSSKQ